MEISAAVEFERVLRNVRMWVNGFQEIGDGLNQQSACFLAVIHQKAEIADIAGEQPSA